MWITKEEYFRQRNIACKGPGVEAGLTGSRNSKDLSVVDAT